MEYEPNPFVFLLCRDPSFCFAETCRKRTRGFRDCWAISTEWYVLFKYLHLIDLPVQTECDWMIGQKKNHQPVSILQAKVRLKKSCCLQKWWGIWETSWRSPQITSACWLWGRTERSKLGFQRQCGLYLISMTWWTPWSYVSRSRIFSRPLVFTALKIVMV